LKITISGWEFPEGICAGNKGHPSDPETEVLKGAATPLGTDLTQAGYLLKRKKSFCIHGAYVYTHSIERSLGDKIVGKVTGEGKHWYLILGEGTKKEREKKTARNF
jgi:hypothetical protein